MNAVLLTLTLVCALAYVTSVEAIDCTTVKCAGCTEGQIAVYNGNDQCCPKCVGASAGGSVKVCPPVCKNFITTCVEECKTEAECSGNKLCCYSGCGLKCTSPVTVQVARPNGAGGCKSNGQFYKVGEVFNADAPSDGCTYCQCMGNGKVKCQPAPGN